MKKFLVIFCLCLITAIQTYKVIPTDTLIVQPQNSNLGFINSTGAVTDQMLKTYVKVIVTAANLFKGDVMANLKYIKEKLDESYAIGSQYYYVFIQTSIPSQQSYSLWMSVSRMIAGFNNVNPINPNWSYLILRTYAFDNVQLVCYLQNGVFGPGMNRSAILAVKNIVETFQTEECTCDKQSVTNIRKSLQNYFNNYQFNVVCDSNGLTSALVYANNGIYGTFKSKCYYSFYKYS